MGYNQTISAYDAASSYLLWWSDAGADCLVTDAPFDWLGSDKTAKAAVPQKAAEPGAQLQTLEALIDHLMTGDVPDAGPANRRLRPTGDPANGLMILIDFPEAADLDASMPLCDPIFDKMLESIGFNRDTAYVSFLCPGRPLTGRIADDSLGILTDIARRHITFVAPKQLWLIGTAASRAILGVDDAQARGNLHHVNHESTIIDTIATAHPRMFDGSKSRKAAAWAEMQRLILREDA